MTAKLDVYNRKRDFNRTEEPEGAEPGDGTAVDSRDRRLRFAVQHHIARRDHYDLRLEWNGVLLSWAVPKGPSYDPHDKRLAVRVEDHPLAYRSFEGTIPQGEYGGGTVMLWDEGFWEPLANVEEGLRGGDLKFVLEGHRLKGAWALIHMKPKPGERDVNWLLIKEKDGCAQTSAGIAGFDTSVKSGRAMDEIAKGADTRFAKNPFTEVNVELAEPTDSVPSGNQWLFEVKYDGYRIVAFAEGDRVRLVTRNGNDYTDRFPAIASSLSQWATGRAMVLDGELVATDANGRTDFQALQSFLRDPAGKRPSYVVFDLLALDGEDLRDRPLIERKELLKDLMEDAPDDLRYSAHVRGGGEDGLRAACEQHLEGIVGKRAGSPYRGARNGDWIKLKCGNVQELVIGGYTQSAKRARGISSLLLGRYEKDLLVYAGRVGSGLGEAASRELLTAFEGLERSDSPFAEAPKARAGERITWLDPQLMAQVKFTEWTRDGLLRHASYQGLRTDKDPRDVHRETAAPNPSDRRGAAGAPLPSPKRSEHPMEPDGSTVIDGVRVTNPGKLLFEDPPVTKEDVVRYYARVAERMLPYAGGRILSIVRCPRGAGSACFFKKHPGPDTAGVVTVDVASSDGEREAYFYVDSAAGLVSEAQMDTLEFHIWGSRADALEHPDMMVFDLDPDKGLDLWQVRRGVRDLKGILDGLALSSFLKTSGGKGYHVTVPFEPSASWDAFHGFARRIAQVMAEKWPDRYTSNVRLAKRTGKVFIDWMRNGRGATSVAPYSLRARSGARVSMPLSWDELDSVAPDAVTMEDALARIERDDPWEGYFKVDQSLA